MTTAVSEPGPNRFVLHVDGGTSPRRARLRFTPIDDPGVSPTTLGLRREGDATYAATGANLAFDGRWRVDVQLDRTTVPLELDPEGPRQFLSVLRPPGKNAEYTHFIPRLGYVRLIPDRATGLVEIRLFDVFASSPAVRTMVFTSTRHGKTRRVPVKRLGRGRYATATAVGNGDRLAVIARLRNGKRMRSVFAIRS